MLNKSTKLTVTDQSLSIFATSLALPVITMTTLPIAAVAGVVMIRGGYGNANPIVIALNYTVIMIEKMGDYEMIIAHWQLYTALLFGVLTSLIFSIRVISTRMSNQKKQKQITGQTPDMVKDAKVKNSEKLLFAGEYRGEKLYTTKEDRGLIFGPSGSGKTVFLYNQILSSMEKKLSFVALDTKPEIADTLRKALEAKNYKIIEIDTITGRADKYNPLSDLKTDKEIDVFAYSIIPTDDKDPIWTDAQRDFLRLALLYLKHAPSEKMRKILPCSLPNAYIFLTMDRHVSGAHFLQTCQKTDHKTTLRLANALAAQYKDGNPVGQAWGTLTKTLSYLGEESMKNALSNGDFSLSQMGDLDQPVALFLIFRESELATEVGGLLSAFYGHIINYFIDNKLKNPVALYLDEVGNIPPINGLQKKLNTIRSRNIPTWLYFQSIEQIEPLYGRGSAEIFFSACPLRMFFRANDIETATMVEKLSGTVLIEKQTQSINGKSEFTDSVTTERVPLIDNNEVMRLADSEVITFYRGLVLRGMATPHYITYPKYRR